MPILNDATFDCSIQPDELASLQRIFDRICERRAILSDGHVADSVASQLIGLFQSGIRDERQLLSMLSGTKSYP